MKANELMIGDLVYSSFSDIPCKVQYLELRECGYGSVKTSNVDGIKDIASLSPIPLTPEILEKNGFHINGIPNSITSVKAIDDWSDDTYVWSQQETPDERMFVSVYMDTSADFFVEVYCQYCHADGIHVKYLHELQHALKLCGIGIEIRL